MNTIRPVTRCLVVEEPAGADDPVWLQSQQNLSERFLRTLKVCARWLEAPIRQKLLHIVVEADPVVKCPLIHVRCVLTADQGGELRKEWAPFSSLSGECSVITEFVRFERSGPVSVMRFAKDHHSRPSAVFASYPGSESNGLEFVIGHVRSFASVYVRQGSALPTKTPPAVAKTNCRRKTDSPRPSSCPSIVTSVNQIAVVRAEWHDALFANHLVSLYTQRIHRSLHPCSNNSADAVPMPER